VSELIRAAPDRVVPAGRAERTRINGSRASVLRLNLQCSHAGFWASVATVDWANRSVAGRSLAGTGERRQLAATRPSTVRSRRPTALPLLAVGPLLPHDSKA